ncbi:PREDICTED: uncharacterized protein LOC109218803 isoform X3 [Nicotiana attenuata]|uniref:uncharacterized protein LOC109218803 isoform X3 n=1 Tax=Nicotiana attenuata TaxID=49451 RepID=UPI00090591FE|nr:PREDICTED: uncharacterized protein LOC109218803 isoform X3 [Nicotiana attenuata]
MTPLTRLISFVLTSKTSSTATTLSLSLLSSIKITTLPSITTAPISNPALLILVGPIVPTITLSAQPYPITTCRNRFPSLNLFLPHMPPRRLQCQLLLKPQKRGLMRDFALYFSGQSGKKRRGGSGGLNKLCGVSPELQTIVGQATLPRTEIVKQLWAYIRKHNLQDPNNKRKIICNDELRLLFETDCTDMFKMNRLLVKHIVTLEPSKQTAQNPKRAKTEEESGSKSEEAVPVVIISEALANFLGISESEMSQAEVLRKVLEYIKVSQLEDPLNSMVIRCNAKLQELLGCESISALGITEMLARHHLFKKS